MEPEANGVVRSAGESAWEDVAALLVTARYGDLEDFTGLAAAAVSLSIPRTIVAAPGGKLEAVGATDEAAAAQAELDDVLTGDTSLSLEHTGRVTFAIF